MRYNPKGHETVVVKGFFKHGTEKATLMQFEDAGEVWIPNSQFNPPSVIVDEGLKEWAMFIPRWLAEKRDINYDEYDPEDWEVAIEEGVSNEPELAPYNEYDGASDEPIF